MTENIYSNPSGYTEIPWQLSVQWFKTLVLAEVAMAEDGLQQHASKSSMRQCSYCGQVIPPEGSGKCRACWREYSAPEQLADDTEELNILTEQEAYLIDADSSSLKGIEESEVVALHNFLVDCLRSACIRQLGAGRKIVRVREGLEVTEEWDVHFRNLFKTEPRVLLWPAVKHAMLGNPLAGEVFEWKNIGEEARKPSSKGKLAGAAALGVLAGFLFG